MCFTYIIVNTCIKVITNNNDDDDDNNIIRIIMMACGLYIPTFRRNVLRPLSGHTVSSVYKSDVETADSGQ